MSDQVPSTPRKRTERKRLRVLFATLLASMMLGCVVALSFVWEPRITNVIVTSQAKNLESKVELLSDALVPFLLQNDFGAVYETLSTAQTRIPSWKVLTLNTADGQQLYPLSPVQDVPDGEVVSSLKVIEFRGRELAQLLVKADVSAEIGQLHSQVRELSILLSFFFLGGLVLIGVLFERWVVRRIAELAAAARQLERGNYDARLPIGNRDEIGLLTDSFATMRRTIRLNEAKLIASRDEAQRAAEAKSRFLAMMSHEIRTPLNGVIPTAELLLEGELDEEQAQLVGTIQDSGTALKAIIDDILDISKLDEGKFVIRSEGFSLQRLVHAVVGMFLADATLKGLELSYDITQGCPEFVIGDEDRLRQVLINLVGNALKFTAEGAVTICVTFDGEAKQPDRIRFEVQDTGIGISAEDKKNIFERFTQVDNRSNRDFQGSGLGLSICQLMVSAMGGELEVESELGKGSRFFFALPLKADVAKPLECETQTKASSELATPALAASNKILVVDDNKTNLKIASAILASLKHSVQTVESGTEALSRLGDEDFDLILMDVNMPGIDGLETTRRIRKLQDPSAQTIVLGLSASAFEEDIEACIQAGMNGFLAKPVSKVKLVKELKKHLAPA